MLAPFAALLAALALSGAGLVPLPLGLLAAALALVLLRSVTPDEAYGAIPWPLLLLVGALLPLVFAVRDGPEAVAVARTLGPVLSGLPAFALPVAALALALLATALLGPTVTALLLLPLAPALAGAAAIRPEPVMAAIALGASCHLLQRSGVAGVLRPPFPFEGRERAWRVMLPLHAAILLVGTAAILRAWPLR